MFVGDKKQPTTEIHLEGFSQIFKILDRGRTHSDYPMIRLRVDVQPISLHIAGLGAQFPGALVVKDGRKFGESIFFGWIQRDSQFFPSEDCSKEIINFLHQFGKDPEKTIAECVGVTGQCCFCYQPVSDPISTSIGYCPICAEKYGLPWQQEAKPIISPEGQNPERPITPGRSDNNE